jgi:hypothetical protein
MDGPPPSRSTRDADERDEIQTELGREAVTMLLYVAVVLLAALIALPLDDEAHRKQISAAVWGTAVGLALAHWFAFSLSSRLYAEGDLTRHDAARAGVQVVGACSAALVATLPLLLFPDEWAFEVSTGLLSALIGLAGYASARHVGAGRLRAVLTGVATLGVGAICVLIKALFSH